MSLSSRLVELCHRFRNDRRGTVLIIFSLLVFVLFGATGLAIDTSRLNRMTMRVNGALDAAALATARELRLSSKSDGELTELASGFFMSNIQQQLSQEGRVDNFSIEIDRNKSAIAVSVDAYLPTALGRVFNISEFHATLAARSVYAARDIELGMMLDVSGSMAGSKISDLRNAAKDLAEIILDDSHGPTKNKIGIAPFSTAVNAGSHARAATANASSSCVTERTGAQAFTDADPVSFPLKKRTSSCPTATVLPLTNQLSTLETHIGTLRDGGSTAGHLGIAWAWYLVSPNWASFWPSQSAPRTYTDPEVMKAIIVMTDGEFNTAYENANGTSVRQAQQLCANIKSSGVTVFSVGFEAPGAALNLLRQCASKSSYFFDARNGEELRDAFKRIANELTGLRLTM